MQLARRRRGLAGSGAVAVWYRGGMTKDLGQRFNDEPVADAQALARADGKRLKRDRQARPR